MKKVIVIILLSLVACSKRHDTCGSVVVDTTDTLNGKVAACSIEKIATMQNHLFDQHSIRLKAVNNFEYAPLVELGLPECNSWFTNGYDRMDSLMRFYMLIQHELDIFYAIKKPLPQSSIFDEVIREANVISASQAHYKYVIVASDLNENTDWFSAYNPDDLSAMAYNPDSMEVAFTHRVKPMEYEALHVFLVFQPSDQISNARFIILSAFYKRIFEKHHAVVTISCNL